MCFGPLEVTFDYEAIARIISRRRIQRGPNNIWRYRDLLPADYSERVDLNAGFTPLVKARNLGKYLGLENLYIKNDSVNPSFSFKDRVVSVATTKALEFGFEVMACASTGNLACSVAAHSARAGMKAVVFIPADLEAGKILGAAIYNPIMVAIDGSYDDVNRLCSEVADNYHWAFVNINMRPYYTEGSKTLAFEVVEQLGWRFPHHIIAPAASGGLFVKVWKGLRELRDLKLGQGALRTRLHLTQAYGCSPIVSAYKSPSKDLVPIRPNTIAKSLAIGNPADGIYALRALRESKGRAWAVGEKRVIDGIKLLAETEGIFTETAGGVTVAGLVNLVRTGTIKRDDVTVALITGNGLKTQEVVEDVVKTVHIEPSLGAFQQAMQRLEAKGR
jgi:threonine synthase